MSNLQWNSAELLAEIYQNLKEGIDKTSSEATALAKQEVHVRTGYLQGSIRSDPAKIINGQVVGQFGTHMPVPPGAEHAYDFWQEFLPTERGGKPYMRPAQQLAGEVLMKNIIDARNK